MTSTEIERPRRPYGRSSAQKQVFLKSTAIKQNDFQIHMKSDSKYETLALLGEGVSIFPEILFSIAFLFKMTVEFLNCKKTCLHEKVKLILRILQTCKLPKKKKTKPLYIAICNCN